MQDAVIVSATRTAVGRAPNGALKTVRPDEMAAAVIGEALRRAPGVEPSDVEDVILGCAMPEAEQGLNVARIASLRAGVPVSASAVTINRFCSSGLQSIAYAGERIMCGFANAIVAGGTESMSMVPMGGNKVSPNPALVDSYPDVYLTTGLVAENHARENSISREEQDAFALRSHQRAIAAIDAGRFADEITPLAYRVVVPQNGNGTHVVRDTTFVVDEGPRRDTSAQALASLRPAFHAAGSVTAGNSSQTSDGASAVLVTSASFAKERGLTPLARFVAYATAGVEPERFGIGPVPAIRKVLKIAGLSLDQVDLVELNEAFAAQVLACLRELPIDPDRLNVNGGAIALGHPLGCTGAKLTTTLVHEMRRRGSRYGMVTMCVGGGMGAAGNLREDLTMAVTTNARKGASWLLEETDASTIFTPEKLSEEHRLMAQTVEEFVTNEVMPQIDQLETKDWTLARALLHRAGELGLLGISVPEQYGGLDLDKASALVVSERIARSASFGAAYGAQANLCILPIVLFGTEAQKDTYLPGLVSGEKVGAYALSESGSGSDALAARTRAAKQADGSWVLNGEKMWMTNGGFADVFIVFAQADGDSSTGSGSQFTAFIVERSFGVKSGKEEHKMGLHGSSTTPILLQDVTVPVENVLGEIGRGHKVALNTLNFGRFKLGAMCSGGCREAISEAAKYAKQRKQFGHAIADFGAIKHKLGEMGAQAYALESLMYRTAGLIDATVAESGTHGGSAIAAALEEFAIEASIAKVMGSEVLDYVLDENVQIHGGNGFVKDYPAERHYRDARVNRIFEGTNEINRMLIPGMLIRRALKGEIGLVPAAKRLQDELLSPSGASPLTVEGLDADLRTVSACKKVALMVLGTAMQTYGQKLTDEQEVLCAAADILIDIYASESAVLRAKEAVASGRSDAALHEAAARAFVNDATQRVQTAAVTALAAMAEGDTLRTLLAALRRVLKPAPVNTIALRRTLADATVSRGGYIVG